MLLLLLLSTLYSNLLVYYGLIERIFNGLIFCSVHILTGKIPLA